MEERYTGCYLGFAPDDFNRYTLGQRLCLYFHLAQESAGESPALPWQYYDGLNWRALAVDDATAGLTRSGIVSFTVPEDLRAATLYAQAACWLRIQSARPSQDVTVYGVYPNTVMGSNRSTVLDETLGSSNEQPSQVFEMAYTPVLAGMELEVGEPAGMEPAPGEEEDLSLTVTSPGTSVQSSDVVWRRWDLVDSFSFSGPADRVYTLDNENGMIRFGDGCHGMIPPRGYNNIVAAFYQYTQGLAGNVGADELTVLRPGFNAIASVSNPAAALGGVNGDTRHELLATAPPQVKANGRAVQLDDFDTLARAASSEVSRAHAVIAADGRIAVGVLAISQAAQPYASPALLDEVANYLRERCLAPLATRIYTCEPRYLPIDVVAQVGVNVAPDQRLTVQQDLTRQLQAFLQPVFGGPEGQGWDFGQTVQAAQATRFLRRDPRVTEVMGLSLNGVQGGNIALAPDQVPVAGSISVLAYARPGGEVAR
nr:putative baseplate assembly protein [Pseudoxanthomonas broegbernensis]